MSRLRRATALLPALPAALSPVSAAGLAGGVVVAGVSITATPSAAGPNIDCHNDHVCIFTNDNYGGTAGDIAVGVRGNLSSTYEDKISSYWNNTKDYAVFFEHDGYTGLDFCAEPDASSADLSNFGGVLHPEDRFSSYITGLPNSDPPETDGSCDYYDGN